MDVRAAVLLEDRADVTAVLALDGLVEMIIARRLFTTPSDLELLACWKKKAFVEKSAGEKAQGAKYDPKGRRKKDG